MIKSTLSQYTLVLLFLKVLVKDIILLGFQFSFTINLGNLLLANPTTFVSLFNLELYLRVDRVSLKFLCCCVVLSNLK